MKTNLLLTILVVCFSYSINTNAQTTFQKTFGGISGSDVGYSVQQTADQGYIITGISESYGAGTASVFLIKTDSSGNTLWVKTFGGSNSEGGYSVQQTTDGGYIITGHTYSYGGVGEIWLIKTNNIGNKLWTKRFGGAASEEGKSVQQTADQGYIITGFVESFGAGDRDVYLIKTNNSGNIIWTKTFGGTGWDEGTFVRQTSDGGYIITGFTESFGVGGNCGGFCRDVYLIKTNSSGDTLWTKTYGGLYDDEGYSVQQTVDGGYIITGTTSSFPAGFPDFYLIKTDANGDALWTKTYGGANEDYGYSVQQTADGGYIIIGSTSSFGAGSRDVYLIKTNSSGDTLWTKTYGGTFWDEGYSVRQTADGGYIITGSYSFQATFSDFYLIKTDDNGNTGGCNQYSTATITGNPLTIVGFGAIIDSGGVVNNTSAVILSPTNIDSVLCKSGSVETCNDGIQNQDETDIDCGGVCPPCPTGISQSLSINKNQIKIHPNPFSTHTLIEFGNYKKEKYTLALYNSLGQLVRQIDNISNGQIRIERDNLTSGLYFFQLRTDSEIIGNGKFIIE